MRKMKKFVGPLSVAVGLMLSLPSICDAAQQSAPRVLMPPGDLDTEAVPEHGAPPMPTPHDGVSTAGASALAAQPPVSAVPEASTWPTLLIGCIAIGGHGLLRRKSTLSAP